MWKLSYLHYLLNPTQRCSLIVNVGNKTTESTVPVTDTITTNNKSQIFSCHIRVVADIEKHPGHSLLFKNCGCYSICSSETGGPRQLDPGEPRTGGCFLWNLVKSNREGLPPPLHTAELTGTTGGSQDHQGEET